MDIGTPVLHTDDDDNTYAGQIVGRDFEMRTVYRDKAGNVRRNPDGTLADKSAVKTDVGTTEKVDTGLFNVLATYRDGHQKVLIVAPEDLDPVPSFDSVPVFSHGLPDSPAAIAGVAAGSTAAPAAPDAPAPDSAPVAPALTSADHSAIAAQVIAAMKAGA